MNDERIQYSVTSSSPEPHEQRGERSPSTILFLSLDADGTVRFADEDWTRLTGADHEAVVGRPFTAVLTDESVDRFETALADLDTGQSVDIELFVRDTDGRPVPVRMHAQSESGESTEDGFDESTERVHCHLRPLLASGTSSSDVLAQNALLRTLFDALPVGILAETADRTVLAANDELLSMFDVVVDRSDVVGADCTDLAEQASVEFTDPDGFVADIEARIAQRERVVGEQLERTDGRIYERSYFPIDLPGDDGHLWVYDDVTDRQRRKSELETYERLFEVAPIGVFRTTTDGRVLDVNRKLAEILGHKGVDGLLAEYGDLGRDLYADPDRREVFLERLREREVVEDFEYEAITVDGNRRWFSMNARLLEETDDGARVITGFTWDVTDRKRHERQLAILGRVLRHNLRNAMTVIGGQAELLRDGRASSPEDAVTSIIDRTDTLLKQAEKERAIVDLLQGETPRTTRDLADLIENVHRDVQQEHPDASVAIDCPGAVSVTVCDRFDRAIQELLDNAIRHADTDEPTVSLSAEAGPETVEVRIADTGPGIPETEKELLRGDTDETPLYHGVGVGLVLVRQLVRESGGSLSFEENEPRGTVVTIRLPA
ncbi:MAG: PAS domain-containing protein [Halapricum sp.]